MLGITLSDVNRMQEEYRKASPEEAKRMMHSNIGASIGMGAGALKGGAIGSAIAPGPGTGIGIIVGAFVGMLSGLNNKSLGDNVRTAASVFRSINEIRRV